MKNNKKINIVKSNNIKLWTEALGNPKNPTCLLISGAGAPAMFWSNSFCDMLTNKNYHIIRYDHRDQGLSDAVNWDIKPYSAKDLADDAVNILNAYKIDKAHIVGHSMGGLIAQLLTIYYPERLFSFTSISVGTCGEISQPDEKVMKALLENKPVQNFKKDLAGFIRSWKILNGDYEVDEKIAVSYTKDLYKRSNHKVEVAWNHINCQKNFLDLKKYLQNNTVPALFMHGEKDPLISLEASRKTAEITPYSQFLVIPKMGHMIFNKKLEKIIVNVLFKHFLGTKKIKNL